MANVPVFLLADRELAKGSITIEVAEMVDEFVWLLEDYIGLRRGPRDGGHPPLRGADFCRRMRAALADYAQLREHSWSAPGHQGGIAFTKLPAGRAFFDFMGENVFRTDMGIERGALGSLARPHRAGRRKREIRGAGIRRAPKLFGRGRHIGIEPQHHAGLHEGGRPGRPRPQLSQVDRAGPDADRCACRSTWCRRATATASSARSRLRKWIRRRFARRPRPAR